MPVPPKGFGGHGACCVCSAVSYFSTRVGSIIGAGRLSFRVRDGSGRFPVAMVAVTLFYCLPRVGVRGAPWWWLLVSLVVPTLVLLVVGCGFVFVDGCGCGLCCKFSAG